MGKEFSSPCSRNLLAGQWNTWLGTAACVDQGLCSSARIQTSEMPPPHLASRRLPGRCRSPIGAVSCLPALAGVLDVPRCQTCMFSVYVIVELKGFHPYDFSQVNSGWFSQVVKTIVPIFYHGSRERMIQPDRVKLTD